jgi:DNA-binding PadR family transcriptional regulator
MKERRPFSSQLSPAYLLLGLLALAPSHGYDLHRQIERDLRYVWRLSLSQVYSVLSRLEKRGLIEGEIMEQDERPDRNRFQLTPAGKDHFKSWFRTPVGASVHAVRIAFLSKLYFAQQLPELDTEALWDDQRAAIEAGLARMEKRLAGARHAHPILEHSLRLRAMQLRTLLEWLSACKLSFVTE